MTLASGAPHKIALTVGGGDMVLWDCDRAVMHTTAPTLFLDPDGNNFEAVFHGIEDWHSRRLMAARRLIWPLK